MASKRISLPIQIADFKYQSTDRGRFEETKLFKKYVDNVICTVRVDPNEHLKLTNSLH